MLVCFIYFVVFSVMRLSLKSVSVIASVLLTPCGSSVGIIFFFQAEDGIRDYNDWSSDVCSSDLRQHLPERPRHGDAAQDRDRAQPGGRRARQGLVQGGTGGEGGRPPRRDRPASLPGAAREIGRASCRERV